MMAKKGGSLLRGGSDVRGEEMLGEHYTAAGSR